MVVSEKQIMQLLTVLYDSVRARIEIDGMFALSNEDRVALYNQILRQQSEELKIIGNLKDNRKGGNENALNIKIEDYKDINNKNLSTRIINNLKAENIFIFRDLLSWCKHELMKIPNLGYKSFKAINFAIKDLNLIPGSEPHLKNTGYNKITTSKCPNCIKFSESDL